MTIQKILLKFEPENDNLLLALHEINRYFGYISKENAYKIASYFSISPAKVYEIITASEAFRSKKPRQLEIEVCTGSICKMKGAADVVNEVERYFKIKANTDSPGKVRLSTKNCYGRCNSGPIIVINGNIYETVKPADVDDILRNYA